ncbi:hypothetical protein FANTH_14409 [Fusarium anthophilum]|uniref:AAA+ ATPase domain-containing protein n=1 Tax=Fusarium anthophilum TaxID=48485 RepID=A0A8H4YIK8_9HYPO|nr:hypothetical protein FANTH_14409 [Fusarium anthophilum]
MEDNTPKDNQKDVTLRASDNKGLDVDGDAGSAQGQRPPADIQIHRRLTEIKRKLRRVDKLVTEICHLKDEIAHDLNTFFEELPTPLPSRGIQGDDDSHASDFEPSAKSANGDIPQLVTAPRIQFRAWKELGHHGSVHGETAPEPIAAIEVPSDEPIGTFEPGAPWDRTLETICDPSGHNLGLPERLLINSTRLKLMLRGFDASLDSQKSIASSLPLTILRPFKILDYHYPRIKSLLKSLEDEAGFNNLSTESRNDTTSGGEGETITTAADEEDYINDIHCLVAFLDDTILPLSKRLAEESDVVRFSDLWYLFPPDSFIYARKSDFVHKVWRVVQRTGGRRYMRRPDHVPESSFRYQFSPFVVDCYYIDFDGRHFVPVFGQFEIDFFDDVQPVSSLPVFPLRIAEKDGLVHRDQLEARSREFIDHTSVRHRYYCGWSHGMTIGGMKLEEANENFDSDVIVDYRRALAHVPAWRPSDDDPQLHAMDHAELSQTGGVAQDIDQDWKWDKKLSNEILAKFRKRLASWTNLADVPDREYLLLLPDRVFGYVLGNRKWASLRVGSSDEGEKPLLPIATDDDPWKYLYSPKEHKEMIRSLLEQMFRNSAENENVDIVRGKGRGLILLLHGPPGVGKTFTAECAALATKRPLFSITCGDLGLSAEDIERNLKEFFRLSHAWGCVLLLDEADVFLSKRKQEDILRNSLVSVFLRTLEYYPGVLFLTTNRAGDFDEAFASRIHISLHYPALDLQGTCVIWNNMLSNMKRRHRGMVADDEALLDYARQLYKAQSSRGRPWNGRQIRNAFQSAVAIADFEKEHGSSLRLTTGQFRKVSQSYDEFNQYRFSIAGESIPASEDAVIERSRPYAQRHRDREAPGEFLPHSTSPVSSGSPRRPRQKTDNGKELYSAPLIPPSFSNPASQEQQNFQPKQNWNHPGSSLDVQPQSHYAPPGWAPIQNMTFLPISMGYSPMGMSVPMPMAAPFQCHNAAMSPYNLGGPGSPFQPPNTPGVLPQYSQFANHFQSQPIGPQATQTQSCKPQSSQPGLGQTVSSERPLGKESGGGFWGRFNYDDQTSHPSA